MSSPLLRAWNFKVTLTKSPGEGESGGSVTYLGDGGFQECSGLEVEMDVQEYLEGGFNNGVIRRIGRAKYSPIVLKRGMFHASGETVLGEG